MWILILLTLTLSTKCAFSADADTVICFIWKGFFRGHGLDCEIYKSKGQGLSMACDIVKQLLTQNWMSAPVPEGCACSEARVSTANGMYVRCFKRRGQDPHYQVYCALGNSLRAQPLHVMALRWVWPHWHVRWHWATGVGSPCAEPSSKARQWHVSPT